LPDNTVHVRDQVASTAPFTVICAAALIAHFLFEPSHKKPLEPAGTEDSEGEGVAQVSGLWGMPPGLQTPWVKFHHKFWLFCNNIRGRREMENKRRKKEGIRGEG
jgi:hypothetical protein